MPDGALSVCFFFNDTATTEIYTLSLHDALPIWAGGNGDIVSSASSIWAATSAARSEEHTSELQSHSDLVYRLLLDKKKNKDFHYKKQKQKKTKSIQIIRTQHT